LTASRKLVIERQAPDAEDRRLTKHLGFLMRV
jgi:hypothetical protein